MPKTTENKEPLIVRYEPEEVGAAYANVAQVRTSPYDVTITFGRRKANKVDEQGLVIADAIQIYMSPQHARSVATLLEKQLLIYEDLYGPIPSDTAKTEDETENMEEREDSEV